MKKINVEKIIAVAEMMGLYKIISNGVKGVIVENIIDKKRTIILNNSKIFTLDTIRLFVNDGELPINEALYKLYETLNGQQALHHKNSSDEEIKSIFEKAIPDYDKEKVHINNMRKLIQWYNLLHQTNMLEVLDENNSEDKDEKNEVNTKDIEKEKVEAVDKVKDENKESPKKRGRKKKTENE